MRTPKSPKVGADTARRVGMVVRRLRKIRSMPIGTFAELAGIAKSHASMIENGKVCPSVDVFLRAAEALRLPAQDLLSLVLLER